MSQIALTQIAEDFANVQKNSRQIRRSKKFRRPRTGWSKIIQRKVCEEIHDWEVPKATGAATKKTQEISKDTFLVDRAKVLVPFWNDIVSADPTAPFYTAGAANS